MFVHGSASLQVYPVVDISEVHGYILYDPMIYEICDMMSISSRGWVIFEYIFFKKKIGVHSMQCWTATMRHVVTRKEAQKRLQDAENLFRKNLQLKDVC